MRKQQEPVLIFMHIPKAAGSSLAYIIERNFKREDSYATGISHLHPEGGTLDGFFELSHAQLAALRLVTGHMGFGLHEHLSRPAVYVTMLRDPIKRVISQYSYEFQEPGSPVHRQLNAGEMDIKGFVHYYAAAGEMDNLQTRMISGNWHKRGFGPCTDEMLEMAKENLRNYFAVVGLVERFDESHMFLKRYFGWGYTLTPKRNKTKKRLRQEDFSREEIQYIREHNEFDLKLYAYVQELFQQRVEEAGPLFTTELKLYQSANKLYNIYWNSRRNMRRKRHTLHTHFAHFRSHLT